MSSPPNFKIQASSMTRKLTDRFNKRKAETCCTVPRLSDRQLGLCALLIVVFCAFQSILVLLSVPPILEQGPIERDAYQFRSQNNNSTLQKDWKNTTIDHRSTKPLNVIAEDRQSNENVNHIIPSILIFTHYHDLLNDAESLQDEEEIVLSANIKHSIAMHPHVSTIRFLTDKDCIESLKKVFPSLIPFFQNETEGMFKADICRGSALYETGGMYLDVDVGARKDLWQDLLVTTEFVTARVHRQSKYLNHFFQAILGAAPRSPIIYEYLKLFYDHYTGKDPVKNGPLGVILLRRAWDNIYNATSGLPATELYQEVLYHQKLFPNLRPAPTWGTRRACHFVVVATAHSPENVEVKLKERSFHIPLYSRIPGSRMCPNKDVDASPKNSSKH